MFMKETSVSLTKRQIIFPAYDTGRNDLGPRILPYRVGTARQ